MIKQFRKIFIPNSHKGFNPENLEQHGDELVFCCNKRMFDELVDPRFSDLFESSIEEALSDFDPETDAIAHAGDGIIFAMICFYLGSIKESITILRFSKNKQEFVARQISIANFPSLNDEEEEEEFSAVSA